MNIKLLKWDELTALSLSSDKSVALLSEGTPVAQDRLDFLTALDLDVTNIPINVVTADAVTYTAAVTDTFILADDDTAEDVVAITLPAAATAGSGCRISVKKIGDTANVTVAGAGDETIDGGSVTLTTQYDAVRLVCNGSAWFKF